MDLVLILHDEVFLLFAAFPLRVSAVGFTWHYQFGACKKEHFCRAAQKLDSNDLGLLLLLLCDTKFKMMAGYMEHKVGRNFANRCLKDTVNHREKIRDLRCVDRAISFCCDRRLGYLKGMVACCEWISGSRACNREVDALNS